MAKKLLVVDDLDGSPDAETYEFAWKGETYTIDLSTDNAKELQDFLSKYIDAAAKVTNRLPRAERSSSPKSNKEELARIREWATKEGLKVSPRGRISGDVIKAYEDAH